MLAVLYPAPAQAPLLAAWGEESRGLCSFAGVKGAFPAASRDHPTTRTCHIADAGGAVFDGAVPGIIKRGLVVRSFAEARNVSLKAWRAASSKPMGAVCLQMIRHFR